MTWAKFGLGGRNVPARGDQVGGGRLNVGALRVTIESRQPFIRREDAGLANLAGIFCKWEAYAWCHFLPYKDGCHA